MADELPPPPDDDEWEAWDASWDASPRHRRDVTPWLTSGIMFFQSPGMVVLVVLVVLTATFAVGSLAWNKGFEVGSRPKPVVWSGSEELSAFQSVDVVLPLDKGSVVCYNVTFSGGLAYFAVMDSGGHYVTYSYGPEVSDCYQIPYDSTWYFFAINIDDYDGVHVEYTFTLYNR